MTEAMEREIRTSIAVSLTGRCNNCYSKLPGYQVHGPGWNWITPNFGPFCNECLKETQKGKK